MGEREPFSLAMIAAETTYNLWELEYRQGGEFDLNTMMRRLKDLSAYSLTRAEILDPREGVEMLSLAMFFGVTSNPQFHKNQERLRLLSDETIAYQGRAEVIVEEIAQRQAGRPRPGEDDDAKPSQPRLL